jgi:hypothetical protein
MKPFMTYFRIFPLHLSRKNEENYRRLPGLEIFEARAPGYEGKVLATHLLYVRVYRIYVLYIYAHI